MDLRVMKGKRVFVGGQYDFMPTLRFIAEVVKECGFQPIIPYDDTGIQVHETMSQDISILETCDRAIFDLSDLGAQLVEMQYARTQHKDMLLVYPVRERRCEPERGKRTILSFEIDHFGYLTFEELRSIVWRFLSGSGIAMFSPPPRAVTDRRLDLILRRVKALEQREDYTGAKEIIKLAITQFSESLELYLELALSKFRLKDSKWNDVLLKAEDKCENEKDRAEISLYRGAIATIEGDLRNAGTFLEGLTASLPYDGRGLTLLAYVRGIDALPLPGTKRTTIDGNSLEQAIRLARTVVDGSNTAAGAIEIHDPTVAIHAINNLAYFSCCEYDFPDPGTRPNGADFNVLRKLQELVLQTQDLEAWHNVFRRRHPQWLDTRGFLVLLMAEATLDKKRADEALRILTKARELKEDLFTTRHYERAMRFKSELER